MLKKSEGREAKKEEVSRVYAIIHAALTMNKRRK